jgi:glycosyltransferase involved in cell wall biosynthesis
MARIKVLEIAEAAGGGVLRHLFQIAEGLDGEEFELSFALATGRMREAEHDIARLEQLGAKVISVPMIRRPAPISDLRALRSMTRLMRAEQYDVVHAHSSKAGFLGRLAARRAGIQRVFYTPHAFAFQCGGPVGWLYREFERMGARFGGTIVAVSSGEKDLAVQAALRGAQRARVIPNAIEAPDVPTSEERAAARSALGIEGDAPVIGTVGRLAPQKGYDDLLLGFPEVLAQHRTAQLVLIGSGPLEHDLHSLAEQLCISRHVTFTGHRNDVEALYAAMDVYVQPSLWEGLPYALLEAMGRGLPVIATNVPGNADLVEDDKTGILVPAGTPSAIAQSIIVLLDDPAAARDLGDAGREKVLREHRLEDFIQSISELYRGD